MGTADRLKWNERYRQGEHSSQHPSRLLTDLADWLVPPGRALDIAGGAGRHSLWLAGCGWRVTLADISVVALEIARSRALERQLDLTTLEIDFETDPFPDGPWDLILSAHFLSRPLWPHIVAALRPGGLFVCIQPTMSNLQRHTRPPAPFLLQDGELRAWIAGEGGCGLELLSYQEGWLAEGRHDAVLVARRLPGKDAGVDRCAT